MKVAPIITLLLLAIHILGFSQEKTFTFKGEVEAYGGPLKGALVEVYDGAELIHDQITKGNGKFQFEALPERQYMVEVSKEELRMKVIWINTRHTKDLKFKVPAFSFFVVLKKEKITPYDELSEIPVTLIKYQPKKKEFYMDKTYSAAIKKKKREIKENLPPQLR